MGKIILVTGAARSGKSGFAEKLAAGMNTELIYFATAQAFDAEMTERIQIHRASRPGNWPTVEEPLAVPEKLALYAGTPGVILLDCLTLWLSNLLLQGLDEHGEPRDGILNEITSMVEDLVYKAKDGQSAVVCVTNEVGWSVVPDNKLGRLYRDLVGRANQILARAAEEVYLVVAGYPMEIKASGSKILSGIEGRI